MAKIKTQVIEDAGEDAEREHSSIAGGIAIWDNHSGNQSGSSSENWTKYYLRTQLYLNIYPKDAPTYNKDTCSTMFIVALFIIARTQKESDVPKQRNWYRICCTLIQWSTTQLPTKPRHYCIRQQDFAEGTLI